MAKKRAAPVETVAAEPSKRRRSARIPESRAEASSPEPKVVKQAKKAEKKVEKKEVKSKETKPQKTPKAVPPGRAEDDRKDGEVRYWLMKAEPEPRIENGIDLSFSIDDLAGKKVPEPWDGIRNHVAKNNILAMRKGDLAFFYHSNCKVPGIVGIMEIVGEAIPDGEFDVYREKPADKLK
jgi:hypothetical protein